MTGHAAMITFRDPPPLQVRVQSLKEPAIAPPTFDSPLIPGLILLFVITIGGIIASSQVHRRDDLDALRAAFSNSLQHQVEAGISAVIPVGTKMSDVRERLTELHAICRRAPAVPSQDWVLVCLGEPIVRDNSYSRYSIRFASRGGKLASLSACPTLVHWKTRAVPVDLVTRFADHVDRGCWRDEANVADNEWTFGTLPDHAFTTAVVHTSDTVTLRSTPTADTLIVIW